MPLLGKTQSRLGRLDDNPEASTRTRELPSQSFQTVATREDNREGQEDAWQIQSEEQSTFFKCSESFNSPSSL